MAQDRLGHSALFGNHFARKPVRIFYAAGPGNVIGTYRCWKAGRDDPSEVANTYSGQFFDLCKSIGAQGYALASFREPGDLRDANIRLEHRPVPFASAGGIKFHLGQIYSGLRMTWLAWRFGADVAVVSTGAHWFSLGLMRLTGMKVVLSLHCVLQSRTAKSGRVARAVRRLNRAFFRRCTDAAICVSRGVADQFRDEIGEQSSKLPITEFIPTYRRASFHGIGQPPSERKRFRVLCAGRIEANKGAFDLLAIAMHLKLQNRGDIEFDLCGSGAALADLQQQAREQGIEATFRCHGHCDRESMRRMYRDAHAVIVPTRSDFVEGFNKVVAEGILAGRPVITSSVCPALEYVREAVVEVPPDDANAYREAIVRLCDDTELYESKRAACVSVRSQFFTPGRGWSSALRRTLEQLGLVAREPAPRPVLDPQFNVELPDFALSEQRDPEVLSA